MRIPEFLEKWGQLMIHNPIAFVVFAIMIAGLTWKVSQFAYSGQISALRERLSLAEEKAKHAGEGITSTRPAITSEQSGYIARYLRECDPTYITESGDKKARIVCVQIPANSNENESIAYRLKNAIESAGWKSSFELRRPEERYQHGIWILGPMTQPGKEPTTRTILKGALANAGLQSRDEEEQGIGYRQPELAFIVLGKLDSGKV